MIGSLDGLSAILFQAQSRQVGTPKGWEYSQTITERLREESAQQAENIKYQPKGKQIV